MRVKVKGFEFGKSYNLYNEEPKTVLDMYVYFSRKNYVLISYYDRNAKVEKKYAASKKYFKEFLRLPFPVRIEEMDNEHFFRDYYNKYNDYYDDWSDTYPCGCCTCCGCSCDDDLYYDYDYEEESVDDEQEVIK